MAVNFPGEVGRIRAMETLHSETPEAQDAPTILVLDDEAAIAELLTGIFQAEGFQVLTYLNPAQALEALQDHAVDLAIVDIMMPVMDGFEFCRRLRRFSDVPVVFLTAKDEETDVVVGFALGADDYITKPFKPRELVARVKARMRRAGQGEQGAARQDPSVLSCGGIEVDVKAHKAWVHDVPLALTPKEFDILALLLQNEGAPVPSRTLYEQVWGEEPNASSSNTVMVHIRHLRCKLAEVDSSTEFIKNAWGVGYLVAAEGSGAGGRG